MSAFPPKRPALPVREMCLFAVYGAAMFVLKMGFEWLPNIHPIAVMIVAAVVVYRGKALYPLYVYVLLDGLIHGFSIWWGAYLYIWLPVWGLAMLIPRKWPRRLAVPAYMLVCGLHGLAFGALYMPFQVVVFHLNGKQALAWWLAGLSFDAVHGAANFALGALVPALAGLLKRFKEGG